MTHRTALAEAEVEYADHASPSIYVRLPITSDLSEALPELGGQPAAFVIWTTTPWTLPANLAVVGNPELDYVALPVARDGGTEYLIVAAGLAEAFVAACRLECPPERWVRIAKDAFRKLEGTHYTPPFPPKFGAGGVPEASGGEYRLYFARHATLEAGTGLVHTAPGHGAEDYLVGRTEGLPIYAPVDEAGRLTADVATWGGLAGVRRQPGDRRRPGRARVVAEPARARSVRHSYPHCWRCKHPVIFRATEQWFARLGVRGRSGFAAPPRARRDRPHALDPGVGREPHPRHDRGAPRLVPVAPARVGRAHPGVQVRRLRAGDAGPGAGRTTSPTCSPPRARASGSRDRPPS